MSYKTGSQYREDNAFRKRARLHQSEYRAEILKKDFDEYGNRLTNVAASEGYNFYKGFGVFNAVKARFPNYSKGLYADMLRSEHIPFNIFIPLKVNPNLAKDVFSRFLPIEIEQVLEMKIEYRPKPREEYLNDGTAFDAYIEYRSASGLLGIIGIEVKYTERDYELDSDSKEAREVQDQNSIYNRLTREIGIYKPEKIKELSQDRYRQIWRNQLLGESMLIKKGSEYSEFTSVILYPAGNWHFTEVEEEYGEFLTSTSKNRFAGITYESLFQGIEEKANSNDLQKWIDYLKNRYLFTLGEE